MRTIGRIGAIYNARANNTSSPSSNRLIKSQVDNLNLADKLITEKRLTIENLRVFLGPPENLWASVLVTSSNVYTAKVTNSLRKWNLLEWALTPGGRKRAAASYAADEEEIVGSPVGSGDDEGERVEEVPRYEDNC
jgi:hypothetical protein